jgi:hypothetical protein
MSPRYRQLLKTLRRQFPQPVSDPVHDAYFVFTILRALDQVDALKSRLGIIHANDDLELHGACFSASRDVEQYCERVFYRSAAATVRKVTTVSQGVPALMACLPKTGESPSTSAESNAAAMPCS